MNYEELKTAIQNYVQSSEPTLTAQIPDFVRTAEDRAYRSVQMPSFWKSTATGEIGSSPSVTIGNGAVEIYDVRVSEEASPASAAITAISIGAECLVTADNAFSNDDSILITGVVGTTQVNGNYYIVSDVSGANFKLKDISGEYINSSTFTAWSSGGTVSAEGGPWRYLLRKDWDFLLEAYPGTAAAPNRGIPKYYATGSYSVSGNDPTVDIQLAPAPSAGLVYSVDYYGKVVADSLTSTTGGTWLSITFPDVLLYGSLVDACLFQKDDPNLVMHYENRFMEAIATMGAAIHGEQPNIGNSIGNQAVA